MTLDVLDITNHVLGRKRCFRLHLFPPLSSILQNCNKEAASLFFSLGLSGVNYVIA